MLNKKYKALIIDCDGTLIPNKMDGMPSPGVTTAIDEISSHIHVGIATSRPLSHAVPIMKHLNLSGPSIISGGAQIVDGKTFKILKEKRIERADMLAAISVFKKLKINYWLQDGSDMDKTATPNRVPSQTAIEMAAINLDFETADKVYDELSKISGIAAQQIISWEKDKRNINITHVLATKQHGILELARLLNISTHQMIGVGDSYNDFPLFMACGLKIAMGNAAEELKAIADYVAPSVEEDGVVDVINKFVLA